MFLGHIFTKNAKNDPKTPFEASKSVKNKIREITVKSRNDVKSVCFWHVLCHISAIFEDIYLKLCANIHQPLSSNILYVFFDNFDFEGKNFEKEKKIVKNFGNFEEFSKFSKSETAVL